jgi:glycosyltransferase involved in cell wall biosynthesis
MQENPWIKVKLVSAFSDRGPGIGRNAGIENSVGEYLTFLDSDDELDEEIFQQISKTVQTVKEPPDLIVLNYAENSENGVSARYRRLDSYSKSRESLIQDFISMSLDGSIIAMCFKSAFVKHKHHSKELKFNPGIFEDIPFLAAAIKLSSSISVIDQDLYVKHKTSHSITSLWSPSDNQHYLHAWKRVFSVFELERSKHSAAMMRGLRGIIGVCISVIEETTGSPEVKDKYFQELREVVRVDFPFWETAYLGPIESGYDRKFAEFAIRYLV